MSELMSLNDRRNASRTRLLATVSALAILTVICQPIEASASEVDDPTVWIELGGQLERSNNGQDPFAPPFTLISPRPHDPYSPISPLQAQAPTRYSYGGEGKVSFEPHDTDWIVSAALRYGRSNNNKHVHQQTDLGTFVISVSNVPVTSTNPGLANFSDTKVKNSESHLILDFMAGRDVGLGMFGRGSDSVISAGVRFAQFTSKSDVALNARPNVNIVYDVRYGFIQHVPEKYFNNYLARAEDTSSFHGLGPSISWSASVPVLGNAETSEVKFDWGVNGALLFGRQKASGSHRTTSIYFSRHYGYYDTPNGYHYGRGYHAPAHHGAAHNRSRSVTIPNIGAFAGLSFVRGDAKVSMGYRADFFFGVMDSGVDSRHAVNRSFYGPFATISIGLGG